MNYQEFLRKKLNHGSDSGFEPLFMPSFLFDFQAFLTEWAIRKGRAAIFADCGMGKTPMQLIWAENVKRKTNRPVLILTPLAVSAQTLQEAEKFAIEAQRAQPNDDTVTIRVTNYEKLHYFHATDFAGVVCDESSILKNFDGVCKARITEFMRQVPYRLLCTATAAPNDWMELGTSSEALGYLGHRDMLSHFFTRKATYAHSRGVKEWTIRPWAAKGPFWHWVASWARAARKPADLGYDDDGFVLPPLRERYREVKAHKPTPGMLFDMPAISFHEEREAIRRTIPERCEAAAERVAQSGGISMVWCHLNDESSTLVKLIPGAVEIRGSDSDEKKEEAAQWFVHGKDECRVLISKPTIFGFGLNFQHCAHMTYFPTHSYEQYYQATRRLWRFGQESPVVVDLIYTNGGKRMMRNLARKATAADKMFDELVTHMNHELHIENTYERKEIEIPQWIQQA